MQLQRWAGVFRVHRILPLASLVLVLFGFVALWYDGARQPYVRNDFAYNADLVTTDTFYDTVNKRYAADRYAKGVFFYRLIGASSKEAQEVQYGINVSSISGEPVGSLSRTHKVNARTGQYEPYKDATTPGYVFAPRNLKRGESFTYRHITYNVPATMTYVGEEDLFGVHVYHYETNYSDVGRIEQKEFAVPGIPDGQGIEYKPYLQIWVEPVSGWLVKFQDDTQINYFDRATGKELGPFNHFLSRYTEESVRQQADYAHSLQYRLTFANKVAPGAFFIVVLAAAIVLLLRRYSAAPVPMRMLLAIAVAVPCIALSGWVFGVQPLTTLYTGTSLNPLNCLLFVAIAVCIWLIHWRKLPNLAVFLAGLVAVIAGLQLLGGINAIPFDMDLIFFRDTVLHFGEINPSRTSLYGAFAFLLFGVALLKATYGKQNAVAVQFAKLVCGVIIALSTAGLLITFLRLDQAFRLSLLHSFSIVSAVLFIVSALACMVVLDHAAGVRTRMRTVLKQLVRPAIGAAPLVVIGIFAQLQQNVLGQQLQAAFDKDIAAIESAEQDQVQLLTNTLVGARALYAASQDVTSDEWRSFVGSFDTVRNYPGVQSIGFARGASGSAHVPVQYIEPATTQNMAQVGYDLYASDVLSEAMDRARDSGQPSMSNKLQVPLAVDASQRAGFVIFIPVYANGMPTVTTDERRQALTGYVFSTVDMRDLMQGTAGVQVDDIDYAIYNGLQATSTSLLYEDDSHTDSAGPTYTPRLTKTQTVYYLEHPWTQTYKASPSFRLSPQQERLPAVILLGGSLAYLVVAGATYLAILSRREARQTRRK